MPPRANASRSLGVSHAALLAGVSLFALLASPVKALPLAATRGGGAATALANAAAAAMASVQQAQQATQQSMSSLLRASQAIQAMQQAQAQARAAAQQAPSNAPNGLVPGGLQVAPNVGTDPALWQNAGLPSQSVNNGLTNVTIQQTAQKAILTWQTFNVGKQTSVYFNQSAGNTSTGNDWIALNRVVDPSGVPSQILGQIKAEGSVYILNRNGIVFGGASQVNVNSLLVSSLPFMGEPANLAAMTPGSAAYDQAVQASNTAFLTEGIAGTPNTPILGAPSFGRGFYSAADIASFGPVAVDAGAQIDVGALGYALLAAPSVSNAGTISAPDGQAVLAAGVGLALNQPTNATTSWLYPVLTGGFLNTASGDPTPLFTATNTGLIEATTGNVTLIGSAVDQAGVVAVTTSITRPGSITITAADEAQGVSFALGGRVGPITFETGSTLAVLPEEDGETTTSDAAANTSFVPGSINILGSSATFDTNTLLDAPGASVSVTAIADPLYSHSPFDPTVAGRIYVDTGAVLDVSGLPNVELPMSDTLVTIGPLTADDLADSPLQRAGFLLGQTVTINSTISGTRADGEAWVGSPLVNAQGYVDEVPRTIDQMLVNAGTLNLAGGEVITTPGSVLNLTGGYFHYLGGTIATTRLIDASGAIVDIADADPDDTFVGFAGQMIVNHPHWGITETFDSPMVNNGTFVPDLIQGANAGALNILASQTLTPFNPGGTSGAMVLDGTVKAGVETGHNQVAGGDIPQGGTLNIGDSKLNATLFPSGTSSGNTQGVIVADTGTQLSDLDPDFSADTSLATAANLAKSQTDPTNQLYTSTLSAPLLDAAGFSAININATTNISVDAPLAVQPGGSISLTGGAVAINADLTAPGGAISIVGTGYVLQQSRGGTIPALLFDGDINVASGVTISAAGRWVNDTGLFDGDITGDADIDGGSISLTTNGNSGQTKFGAPETDITGSIDLQPGSVLDVSSGGYIAPNGVLKSTDSIPDGKGGSITLSTYNFSGGAFGSLSGPALPTDQPSGGAIVLGGILRGYGFAGGGTLTLQTLGIQIGDLASAPSYDLVLPDDFFTQGGFGSYDLKALYDATIAPGTTVRVSEQNFIPNLSALLAAPTGANLYGAATVAPDGTLVSAGALDPFHRQAAGFAMSAGGYLNWSSNDGGAFIPVSYPTVTGTLFVGEGASILADAGADVALTSNNQLTDFGTIIAHGGTITLNASGPSPSASVWLGADAVLDASGVALVDPFATEVRTFAGSVVPLTGKVLDGGTVSITDDIGTVVAEVGSQINVSGASATFDVPQGMNGLGSLDDTPSEVWSNAGSITLGGANGLLFDGILIAHAGAAQADGGTLILPGVEATGIVSGRTAGIILQQSGDLVPTGLKPGDAIDSKVLTPGIERFAVDRLDGSGIDSLVIGADPVALSENALAGSSSQLPNQPIKIGFAGDVSIHLARSFIADGTEYAALQSGATNFPVQSSGVSSVGGTSVSISAPYVDLGGSTFIGSGPARADGSLSVQANTLDLTGQIDLQNFGAASFNSTGDIRFYTPTSGTTVEATELVTSGDLDFRAAQIYPATANTAIIDAIGPTVGGTQLPTTVTFESNGNAAQIPLSAGGSLLVDATNIVQDGTIRAPSGTLVIGVSDTGAQTAAFNNLPLVTTQSVTLGAGSVTSVSLDGVTVPYGTTVDGIDWQYQVYDPNATNATFPDLTAPPAKSISLGGNSLALNSGATIDLSGGGTIQASEWVAGTGGSRNLLLRSNTVFESGATPTQVPLYSDGRPIYAVIPGYNGPVAPVDPEMAPSGAAVGEKVYLSGVAGLPAGFYTLLPAQYALLPGAYRVVQQTGTVNSLASQNAVLADGSGIASGYFVDGLTGARGAQTTSFLVQSRAVWGQYSQYNITNANTYFANLARQNGTAVPRLPQDAGQLALAASHALTLGATLVTAPGKNGQGALVDIASQDIEITGSGEAALPGYLQISAGALDSLGAASLLIGGTRSFTTSGETIDVAANSIVVANDANNPLTGPEIILVTKTDPSNKDPDAPNGLLVESGSVIEARGRSSETPETITFGQNADSDNNVAAVDGDGALLAVSQGGIFSIIRDDLPANAQGLLNIEGGVTLAGGAGLTLDASGNTLVDPSAILSGTAIAADSGLITFVDGNSTPAGLTGMVIGAGTLAQFANAQDVILRSYGAIDFEGNVDVDVPNSLTLSAGTFSDGAAGNAGNISITAGTLVLSNDLDAPAPASVTPGSASLSLNANEIDFGSSTQGADTSGFTGFGALSATARNGIVGQGGGTFDFGALPVILSAPVIIAGEGGNATLKTTGVLTLNSGAAGGATSADQAFGGAITLIGGSVSDAALVEAIAGNVSLEATTGDLDIADGASLDAPGFMKQFIDTAAFAPGGNIRLTADDGAINVAAGAVLDFGGTQNGGAAGAIILTASQGVVNLAGTLEGGAATGYQGGSFTLTTGGSVDLDTLAATLAASGVNKLISVTTGSGNLVLSAGSSLTAANVSLTANGGTTPTASDGNVAILGTIDVSGPAAGEIDLYGKSGVDVEGMLQAMSSTPAQAGGIVTIGTTGTPDGTYNTTFGYENVDAADSGTIHVGAGAIINVAGGAGTSFDGTISFRAPLLENGDVNIVIDNPGSLVHARSVTIEPYAVWSTTDSTSGAQHFDGIVDAAGWYDSNGNLVSGTWTDASGSILAAPTDAATLKSYLANDIFSPDTANADHTGFYGYGSDGTTPGTLMGFVENPGFSFTHDYSGIANLQVRSGIELVNPADSGVNDGAISVLTNWNLAAGASPTQLAFRNSANGLAPIVSILAGGNLNIEASITDGFFQQNDGALHGASQGSSLGAYQNALDAYNAAIDYLANDSFSGHPLWQDGIIYEASNNFAGTNIQSDPYYQPVQAPLTDQSTAYYQNYNLYISDVYNGSGTDWAELYNSTYIFSGLQPYIPNGIAGAPDPATFATYTAYAGAYASWLSANFSAGNASDGTPAPLLAPGMQLGTAPGSNLTAGYATYAAYSTDYAEYAKTDYPNYDISILNALSPQLTWQLMYAPFAPAASAASGGSGPGSTSSGYQSALTAYNTAIDYLTNDSFSGHPLWQNGIIFEASNGFAGTNIQSDPYYQPVQAPLTDQSAAYYQNYNNYISQVYNGSGLDWAELYNNSDSTGLLPYKPNGIAGVPDPATFTSYTSYADAYTSWLENNFGSFNNTTGTPAPLLAPGMQLGTAPNGNLAAGYASYAAYSTDYTEYTQTDYPNYSIWILIAGSGFPEQTQLTYAPFAPAGDAASSGGGSKPTGTPGPDNSPSNMPTTANPASFDSATLLGGSSSSYRLVAGADTTSANPLAVIANAAGGSVNLGGHFAVKDTTSGDNGSTLLFPTTIRTGTGSIDIASASDINWQDNVAPAAIYTGGAPAPGTPAASTDATIFNSTSSYFAEFISTGEVHPVDAGDIKISAGRDINSIEQVFDADGSVTGTSGAFNAQTWWQWMETANPSDGSASSINFAAFDQGIMSAGGNVSVTAGGNITELSVSLPTTWYLSNGAPVTVGGGNLSVTAGGNILSGTYFVANGTGTITAGGAIGPDFSVSGSFQGQAAGSTPVSTLLGYQNTDWTVTARQTADIGGVYDPSYLENPLQVQGSRDGQNPTSESALSINSITGDAKLDTMLQPTVVLWGQPSDGQILPASLEMTAFSGNIAIDGLGTLYPSANGQLTLLADQSLSIANEIVGNLQQDYFGLADVDPSQLPSPTNQALLNNFAPFASLLLPQTGLPRSSHVVSHANDSNPVRIYALNGDIIDGTTDMSGNGSYSNSVIIEPNKPAFIEAGHDIVNLSLLGENFYGSDVTRVIAGHDIFDPLPGSAFPDSWVYYLVPALELEGPGYFDIQAGRNIGPLTSANEAFQVYGSSSPTGIQTLGDFYNASLPPESASISILFGVAPGINDAGFAAAYIDPSASPIPGVGSLTPDLVSYVEQVEDDNLARAGNGGADVTLTPDQAWTVFNTLPQYQQQAFIDKAFFNVLTQVGADYNNSASPFFHQYERGYDAINALFPSSYGYTQNNLGGGSNGANSLVSTGTFDMRGATVQTQEGGDVNILGPGGEVLVGSASAPPFVVDSLGNVVIGPNQQGILTLETGDVDIFSDQSLLLAQSRVFTEQGGDMTIWSSNGDINAGQGAKTTSAVPPPDFEMTPDAFFTLDAKSQVTGAGIATLQTIPDAPRGNVFLIAPRGTVDAGAAGIRVSGDLTIAALHVVNAFNIEVQGVTVGVPTVTAPNIGALDSASSTSGAATKAITSTGQGNNNNAQPSILIVEVEGYGGDDGVPAQTPSEQRPKKRATQGFYDQHSRYQIIGLGSVTPEQAKRLSDERRSEMGR